MVSNKNQKSNTKYKDGKSKLTILDCKGGGW